MLSKVRLLWIPLLLFAFTACSESTTRIGVLQIPGRDISISVPEIAERGETIQITLYTWGSCATPARTEARVNGMNAIVTPYDTTRRGTYANPCPLGIGRLEHTATLTFNQVGTATVTIRGRRNVRGNVTEVVRTIDIQ